MFHFTRLASNQFVIYEAGSKSVGWLAGSLAGSRTRRVIGELRVPELHVATTGAPRPRPTLPAVAAGKRRPSLSGRYLVSSAEALGCRLAAGDRYQKGTFSNKRENDSQRLVESCLQLAGAGTPFNPAGKRQRRRRRRRRRRTGERVGS